MDDGPALTVKERVEKAISRVRPYIQSDGGDISLVAIHEDTGIVEVSLHGACGSCPSSLVTLKGGVERAVRAEAPEIKEVVTV
ncbi:MAG TPA: NifU family protein [Elusimicrobiota bacterium]|nr:NifU family protein [Elusimicrobiota bacterium]